MADVSGASVPRRVDPVVQAHVDGDLVLLSPKDFGYFGAVGSGEAVWELIDGRRSVAAIATELAGRYGTDAGLVAQETADFVDALVAAGLVVLVDAPGRLEP